MNETLIRLLTGIGFVIVMVGAPLLGPWVFLALMCLINILALVEYSRIFKTKKYAPYMGYTVLVGTLCFLVLSMVLYKQIDEKFLILILPLLLTFFVVEIYSKRKAPFARASISMGGIIYISLSLSIFPSIALVGGEFDPWKIIGCLILIWSNDTFAYVTGRLFGKTPLFPSISPKKTWEGTIGGGVCAVLVSIILHHFNEGFSHAEWIGLAVIFVIFSSWGDLVESRLKRSFDIKDSGTLLPGHGGILDRFDAQLFSVPFAAAYLWLMH